MATVIRLKRMGRTKIPFFRIVVSDDRLSAKAGKYVEEIGYYNPKEDKLKIDNEKCSKWLERGVRISDTVKSLLKKSGIQIPVKKKKKKEK
jgi:small subunit ribosomal protein S16